jgi:hypothetical protein
MSGGDVTSAANDLGTGITGLTQVGAGALMLLVGFLLLTGLGKGVTRLATKAIPVLRLVR